MLNVTFICNDIHTILEFQCLSLPEFLDQCSMVNSPDLRDMVCHIFIEFIKLGDLSFIKIWNNCILKSLICLCNSTKYLKSILCVSTFTEHSLSSFIKLYHFRLNILNQDGLFLNFCCRFFNVVCQCTINILILTNRLIRI